MLSDELLIILKLAKNIRVNETLGTVEIYDDYGVKLVLRDLTPAELDAFKAHFPKY